MAFIEADHRMIYLLPPSLADWLPDGHLARFVVDIVNKLDLTDMYKAYRGNGSPAYAPEVMVALLFYGYAVGVFSSRKLERGTFDSVALRYTAANTHPDHDTIATFRRRFLPQLQKLFGQILNIAGTMDVLRIGAVCLDGSKIKANASKHKALSYGHASKLEKQINEEVRKLLEMAEAADAADLPDELSLPEELANRAKRLAAIDKAKKEIERRSLEREERAKQEYEEKLKEHAQKEKRTGRTGRGKGPKPPASPGPSAKDQVNLTDEDSRIMPTSGGGFEQSYNVQTSVDAETMLIVGEHVTQHVNDKLELTPALTTLLKLSPDLGAVTKLIADNGYYSEANVRVCESSGVGAFIAAGREKHHIDAFERFSDPAPLAPDVNTRERMRHKLRTRAGRAIYALRKQVVEPVFGIIKEIMGFRRFMLRGLASVRGEWSLVCMAFNIKRLHKLTSKHKEPGKRPENQDQTTPKKCTMPSFLFFLASWIPNRAGCGVKFILCQTGS
jgi:transposase